MTSALLTRTGRALRGFWRLLDATRRTLLNLLLLLLVMALAYAWLKSGPPPLQPKTALVLDFSGRIAEQRSGSSRASAIAQLRGEDNEQTRLRDVLSVIDTAAKDDKISHAVLVLDGLADAGLPTMREVSAALQRFKAAGKPVVAWGSNYDQRQYYLAAQASEVWLDPMGAVYVEGYGRFRSYYKELFDKLGVTANVLRAGKFKNAAETYTASGPSPETVQADSALYGALWATWTTGVETARKAAPGSVAAAIESLPASLVAVGGDAARWALERKWVDALKTRDELRAAMIQRGAEDTENKTFRQVSFEQYLSRIVPKRGGDAVGVVVAEGSISDGRAPPGRIGGLSTAEMIRKARQDEHIKALVLRVDSPGGTVFGSELVRRELELTRQAGKPVVVSMGNVAASGGYWISTAADEIIADEATITGSIGVVALLPSAAGALDKLGIRTGGVTTTWLGTGYDPRRGIEPRFAQLMQASIDHVYADFIGRVATARKTTPEKINEVAQGRVWAGRQALALGLVDRLGSYGDALKSAAERGKLKPDYRVQYVEAEPGRLEQLLQRFGVAEGSYARALISARAGAPIDVQAALLALGPPGTVLPLAGPLAAELAQDLGWITEVAALRQPFAALTHCLCVAP